MNLALPQGAADFGASSRRAVVDAGGFELFRRAEEDPGLRTTLVEPMLERLGLFELDPREDVESAMAAAELCRLSGAYAVPYPVVATLGAPPAGDWRFAALVDERGPWIEHADLAGPWLAIDREGRSGDAEVVPATRNPTLVPFARAVRADWTGPAVGRGERALLLDLDSSRILGALEMAHGLAVAHVQEREQFGRPLAAFQAVQFHVADCEVAVRGLRQLLRYTFSRWGAGAGAWTDALALRTFALETAGTVLSTAELLHGATGFCNEHDLTVITRSVQGPVRLPVGLEETTEMLASAIDVDGFDGLFSSTVAATGSSDAA
ncbi:MAG TPA: acyl-CoA dehydrogenase family protein [Acidimicrobiales bacterium]|nr:acyl-CoA dehydrogenase family protein [Acidimicrobiales bacterium]